MWHKRRYPLHQRQEEKALATPARFKLQWGEECASQEKFPLLAAASEDDWLQGIWDSRIEAVGGKRRDCATGWMALPLNPWPLAPAGEAPATWQLRSEAAAPRPRALQGPSAGGFLFVELDEELASPPAHRRRRRTTIPAPAAAAAAPAVKKRRGMPEAPRSDVAATQPALPGITTAELSHIIQTEVRRSIRFLEAQFTSLVRQQEAAARQREKRQAKRLLEAVIA